MLYVVLGVEFSGTTLVSELMHHAGIRMIDDVSDQYDSGGKYEHPEFQQINKQILGLSNDKVFQLRPSDCPQKIDQSQADKMSSLVERQGRRYRDWGFKDPRTVVTYPLWRALLPPHRVVAVYRDPAGNWARHRWRGLRRRYTNAWRAFVHLRQWYEHNEAILASAETLGQDFLLLNYERLMGDEEEVGRLTSYLGRSLEDRRRASMYRSRSAKICYFAR